MDRFADWLAKAVKSTVDDIRHKVLEEGWFGKSVTGRNQTITVDSPGANKSPGEQLGWWRRDDRTQQPDGPTHDREKDAKEVSAPDRGIDL